MSPAHRQMDPGELFWCILEPAIARSERGSLAAAEARRRLSYAFEDVVPVPVDGLAVAFARRGDRIVGCAVQRDRLRRVLDSDARTLTPLALPGWLGDQLGDAQAACDPGRFNLLVGQDEPGSVRLARRRLVFTALGCLLVLLTAFSLGIERRVRSHSDQRADARARIAEAFATAYPEPSRQPPAVRLASELRTLERLTSGAFDRRDAGQARRADTSAEPTDAAVVLGALLERMPDVALRVDSIEVGQARLALVASVPTVEDAERLGAAWDAAPTPEFPWSLRQPQITAERATSGQHSFRVAVTLERAEPQEPLP